MHGTQREDSFVDYYEYLQVSPSADFETIERVYRLLAKRYHPDNSETGDADKFRILTEAYHVLTDPEQRAGYDASYEAALARQWKIMDETSASDNVDTDSSIRRGILSLLYRTR
ncbi:MAG: DnaJ domain-containing protein, partial [Deltaproteobacteria bacterium]|nr:DnaJ domain-containing protein [Deltaproteobacteria bacterium]